MPLSEADLNLGEIDEPSDALDDTQSDLGTILQILDVVITPAKREQTVESAPSIVSVIRAAEIEDRGYRSVAEALRQVPGVYVRDDLVHPDVSMRGIDAGLRAWGRNVKVMINGQPISYRSDTSNWLGRELIPMSAISRIEVVRGPSSTLYGANAFLGVVNIITKEGDKKEWASGFVGSGVTLSPCYESNTTVLSQGKLLDLCSSTGGRTPTPSVIADFVIGRRIDLPSQRTLNFMLSATVGFAGRSGLMLPATSPHFSSFFQGGQGGIISSDDTDFTAATMGRVSLSDERFGKLLLEGHYSEFSRSGEFTDWSVLTHENQVAIRNWYVRALYEGRIRRLSIDYKFQGVLAGGGDTGSNHLQIAQDNTYWVKKAGGYLGFDLSAEVAYDITRSMTAIGGASLTNDFHQLPSIFSVDKTTQLEIPSYVQGGIQFIDFFSFGQLLWSPVKALSLSGGISYEKHNIYGQCSPSSCPGLNARFGASISLLKRDFMTLYTKAIYGSSFKAPPAELIYGTPYIITGISGNLELQPEVARTFEAAVGTVVLLGDLRIDALLNGYFSLVYGKVEYIQVRNFIKALNSTDLRTVGFESSFKVGYHALTASVSYSWQKTVTSDCLIADLGICQKLSEFNYLYPTDLLSFGAQFRSSRLHFLASLYGGLVGRRWASQSNRAEQVASSEGAGYDHKAYSLPSYLLLNATLSTVDIRLFGKETVFTVGLYNLLNAGIVEPGFNGIDTPSPGLSAILSMRQRL